MRLRVNGSTRLSYYNYTIEVKIFLLFSVILHLDANLLYSFVYLFLYIYIYIYIIMYFSFIYFI